MATVASSLKVLNLYFQDDGSDVIHRVRIKDPAQDLSRETVKAAGEAIAQSKVFDFSGGLQSSYNFVKATYYSRKQSVLIK